MSSRWVAAMDAVHARSYYLGVAHSNREPVDDRPFRRASKPCFVAKLASGPTGSNAGIEQLGRTMKLKFDVSWDSETRRWGASFTPEELWRSASVLIYILGAVRRDPTIPRLAIDRTRLAIDGRLHTDAILNTEPFKAWYGAGHVLACEAFDDEAKRQAWTLLTAEDFIRFVEWGELVLALDPHTAEDDLPVSCEIDLVADGPTARDAFLGLRHSIGNERDHFEDDMYPARGDLTIPELPHDPGSDGPTIGPLWVGQQNARLGENGQLDPIRLRCQPADPHADPPVPASAS